MKKAYIKHIEYYLPDVEVSNGILSKEFPEWSVDKISKKTGIFNRYIARDDEFVSDMAIKAAKLLFENNSIDKNSIDFVLLCTQSPDYKLPTTACIVQDRLGLAKNIGALDFNLGCSGYIYGLALAKGLIESSIAKNVLLITSETYSKYIHPADKSNRTIFGDAATASLISSSGFAEILSFELGSDGSGADNLIVKNGGSKMNVNNSLDFTDEYGNLHNDSCLYMNGPEIFSFTSAEVPKLVESILLKNNLLLDEVGLHIFHQANHYMLTHLRKKLKIEEEKFYVYLENCGNTVSSTIPIALFNAIKENRTLNNNVLLAGFGVGYSWGGTILKFN